MGILMSLLVIAAASIALGQSTSGRTIVGTPPPITRPTVTADAGEDTGPVICRFEAPMGTNLRRRVCRTQRLIDAERSETRELMRRNQGLPELPPQSAAPGGF